MRLATEDPTLSALAINTAVTTAVGLLVGLVAFPMRWFLQWRSRRRQDDVAAYRQAHRLLRDVEIDALYPEPVGAGDDHDDRAAAAESLRWNHARRAWDETLHLASSTRHKKTYELLRDLAELYMRSPVVEHIFGEAATDPSPTLLAMGIEALAWRERHGIRRLPTSANDLEGLRSLIHEAEEEVADRQRQEAAWRKQDRESRAAAMRAVDESREGPVDSDAGPALETPQ